jgi:Spy/CpxP family protein refolding chaperone
MRPRVKWFLLAALAVLIALPAFGQLLPGRMPFLEDGLGAPFLLMNKGVQKEIKLTEEQHSKIRQIVAEMFRKYQPEFAKARGDQTKMVQLMRDSTRETRDKVEKALPDILSTEQAKRLKQIELQANGVHSLEKPDVQKELKLTDKQKEEVKRISDGLKRDVVAIVKDAASAPLRKGAEAVRKAGTRNNEATKKALAVLNRDQQKIWNEMAGEKFELKIDLLNRPGAKP